MSVFANPRSIGVLAASISKVVSTSSEIFPCVSKIRGRKSSSRAVAAARYFSLFFALRTLLAHKCAWPLCFKTEGAQGLTTVMCLNRFMNSWVEDNVGLESLLGVLVGQTRVLARSYTMKASERHETTLQHVVSREFFLAIDGVLNVKFWSAWTAALVRHVREGLSSCVRHREAHLFVSASKLLRQWVRLPEQS